MNPTPPPPPPPPPGATSPPSHPPNPPQPSPPQPPSALATALSELTSLLELSAATLKSLPASVLAAASSTLVPCPFNPNHLVPPSSLFSHYLRCPSPLSLPHTFHYPLTLRYSSSTTTAAAAPPILPPDSSDLTVSLENYIGYSAPANSFFYQNCPGPVTLSIPPPSSVNLPRVLYITCAEFSKDPSPKGVMGFSVDFIGLFPSEIVSVQCETEGWGGGVPAFYSFSILRAILRLKGSRLLHLYEWIIENSPRYGVIIDSPMRDHVFVLVKLCLKVIVKEAFELAGIIDCDGELKKKEKVFLGLSNQSFECPVLVQVMMWLALQLSVLYGEVNGKFFAVDVLKECINDCASRASVFPLEGKEAELSDGEKVDLGDANRDKREDIKGETVGNSMIFVSEVAAAVAALHERFLIEEKIKALRNSQSLSAYQRYMEHAHVSKLADEERQKRPDYRPIIEHDGSLRQRSSNQEAKKVKTREELLAEERDYKRRRMSYRGKKVKRNTLEVTRDIIEEYMEEIRQAGGIGSSSKAVEETEALASEDLDEHTSAADVSGSRRNLETTEENRGHSVDYRKYRNNIHSLDYSGDIKDDDQQPIQDSSWDHGREYPNRDVESIRYDRDDHSGSQDGRQISSHTREQMHVREKQDFTDAFAEDYARRSHQRRNEPHDGKYYERSRTEHERRTHKRGRDGHERTSRKKERDDDNWEHGNRGRSKADSASREREEDKEGHADRRKSKTNRNSSSRSELHDFDDRYDPAVS